MEPILPKEQQTPAEHEEEEDKKDKRRKKRKEEEMVGPDPRKIRKMDYKDLLLENLPTGELY